MTLYNLLEKNPNLLEHFNEMVDCYWEYTWSVAEMLNLQDALDEAYGR